MREDKLSFGILIRVFVSLLPIMIGMPSVAMIICAYTIAMTFIAVGPMATVVSSLTAVAAAMFLSSGSHGELGELFGLSIGLQAVLCAVGCIAGLFKKRDFYKGLALSTLGILLPQLIYAKYTANADGMSLAQMMVPSLEEFKILMSQTFSTLPQNASEILSQSGITVDTVAKLLRDFTVMIIPSAFIISSLVFAYIVMWSVTAPIRKYPNERIHSFSKIRFSRICAIMTVLLIAYLVFAAGKNPIVTSVMINMLIVFITLAFFSGVSFLEFYLRKLLPFKFLSVVIHVIIIANFSPIYILVAFIDSFANFRKLPKTTEIKGGEAFETKK